MYVAALMNKKNPEIPQCWDQLMVLISIPSCTISQSGLRSVMFSGGETTDVERQTSCPVDAEQRAQYVVQRNRSQPQW